MSKVLCDCSEQEAMSKFGAADKQSTCLRFDSQQHEEKNTPQCPWFGFLLSDFES